MCEIVDSSVIGIDPQVMGLAPFYAIKKLLGKVKMNFTDIDYYEMNEAFAV